MPLASEGKLSPFSVQGRCPWTPPGKPAVSPDPFRMVWFFPRLAWPDALWAAVSRGSAGRDVPRGVIERERMGSTVGGNPTMRRRVWEEPARFLPAGVGGGAPKDPEAFISELRARGPLGEAFQRRWARSGPGASAPLFVCLLERWCYNRAYRARSSVGQSATLTL